MKIKEALMREESKSPFHSPKREERQNEISLNDKNLAQCLRNAFENADEKNEISEKLEEKQVQKSKPIDKDDLMGWDL